MLKDILSSYNAFIIDLWGVVHDGTQLYPGAADALAYLHAQQKPVVFLSNAPRRAAAAEANLERLGIPREHYVQVVTSGEVAYAGASGQWPVRTPSLFTGEGWGGGVNMNTDPSTPPPPNLPPQGGEELSHALSIHDSRFTTHQKYYYLGPSKDEEIFAGAPNVTRVENPADADFVLNTGYAYDFQPHAEVLPLLQQLHAHALPLLCVNPDLEVVKQDGTHMLCAGALAAAFEGIGGTVHYIGKPHKAVYDAAIKKLPPPLRGRVGVGGGAKSTDSSTPPPPNLPPQGGEGSFVHHILAIGDNPLTDILGANRCGIDSLLISGGVLAHHHGALTEQKARALCAQEGAAPTYVAPRFSLFTLPLGEG